MAYFKDYFAYNRDTDQSERMAVPEWALRAGFEDASYSNDAAAQMTLKSNPWIALWVSEEHPLNREYPDEPRYGLGVFPIWDGDTGAAKFFLKSDDEGEILAFLAAPPAEFVAMAAPGADGAADRPKPVAEAAPASPAVNVEQLRQAWEGEDLELLNEAVKGHEGEMTCRELARRLNNVGGVITEEELAAMTASAA